MDLFILTHVCKTVFITHGYSVQTVVTTEHSYSGNKSLYITKGANNLHACMFVNVFFGYVKCVIYLLTLNCIFISILVKLKIGFNLPFQPLKIYSI